MKSKNILTLSLFIVVAMAVSGCSGPSQYPKDDGKSLKEKEKEANQVFTNPLEAKFIYKRPVEIDNSWCGVQDKCEQPASEQELDEKARLNSAFPIVYGKSVVGVDFASTTYQNSLKLLTPSLGIYLFGTNDIHLYRENVFIAWDLESSQLPKLVIVETGYLGTLTLPTIEGGTRDVLLGEEVGNLLKADDTDGSDLIVRMYRFFEKTDEDFNCLAKERCKLDNEGSSDFRIFSFPKMTVLLSKDERASLFRVILYNKTESKELSSPFDLVAGSIHSKTASYTIGENWKEVEKRSGIQGHVRVELNSFHYPLEYYKIGITRSPLKSNYLAPGDKERFEYIISIGNNPHPILIGGKFVVGEILPENEVDLQRMPPEQTPKGKEISKQQFILKGSIPALAGNKKLATNFLKKLVDLISLELEASGFAPDSITNSFSGANSGGSYPYFSAHVIALPSGSQKEGRTIGISIEGSSGNVYSSVSILWRPLELFVLQNTRSATPVKNSSLAGISLGQEFEMDYIDNTEQQALISFTSPSSISPSSTSSTSSTSSHSCSLSPSSSPSHSKQGEKIAQMRGEYTKKSSIRVLQEVGGKFLYQTFITPKISFSGLEIGVVPREETPGEFSIEDVTREFIGEKNTLGTYQVSSVTYSGPSSGWDISCGEDIIFVPHAVNVQELKKTLAQTSQTCVFAEALNSNSNGFVSGIFFPREGIYLKFDKNELKSIMIYPTTH